MIHTLFVMGKLAIVPVLGVSSLILALDGYQVAAIITACGTFVVAVGGVWIQMRTYREVKTINSKSLANLADDIETRRVRDIPEGDKTLDDRAHLIDVDKAAEAKKK